MPAMSPLPVSAAGRCVGPVAGSPRTALRRSATDARVPTISSGTNTAKAARTSTETVTRAQLVSGSSHRRSPPLVITSRAVAQRSNQAAPARTTRGPPPSTDGMRYDSAPVRRCSRNPTTHTAASSG